MITKEQVLNNLDEVKKYIAEAENKTEEKVVGIAIKSIFGLIKFQSSKTTFREALYEAIASGANLRDADLRGANLRGANLSCTDLSGANLSGANLRDADLSGANLSDADLSGADLSGADLRGANLRGANLSCTELNCAKFYGRGGKKPLKRSQLPDFLAALGFVIED